MSRHGSVASRSAVANLDHSPYDEFEKAVLGGDAMDAQLLGVLERWPAVLHIAMIPDIKAQLETGPLANEESELAVAQAEA